MVDPEAKSVLAPWTCFFQKSLSSELSIESQPVRSVFCLPAAFGISFQHTATRFNVCSRWLKLSGRSQWITNAWLWRMRSSAKHHCGSLWEE